LVEMNVWARIRLVFQAHRLLYHSTLGLRVIKKKKKSNVWNGGHPTPTPHVRERELFIDNLLVRIHLIIVMIWWTGLAPWDFEFPFRRCLVDLAVCEPGENWLGEHLDGREFELPSTWIKEVRLISSGRAERVLD